jgi:hypothetical protein
MLVHHIKTVADAVGGKAIGTPEEIIPESKMMEVDKIVPREDAIRVAIIGDQFCEGNSETPAYGALLQGLLGDGYNVRIYSKIKGRAARNNETYFPEYAETNMKEMKKFAPQIILSWFGCSDLSRGNSAKWDEYKPDFIKGYNEIIETLESWGAKLILINPFARVIEDVRKTVLSQEGGMIDTVRAIAEENKLPLVDFFTPTKEQAGLIVTRKKVDDLSLAGAELLAGLAAEEIKKLG